MHMPAQELAHIQTMLIAVRCHGIGERGEAVKKSRAGLPPGLSSRWRAIPRAALRNGKHG